MDELLVDDVFGMVKVEDEISVKGMRNKPKVAALQMGRMKNWNKFCNMNCKEFRVVEDNLFLSKLMMMMIVLIVINCTRCANGN